MSPSLASSPAGRFGTSTQEGGSSGCPDELAAAYLDGALRWLNSQGCFVSVKPRQRAGVPANRSQGLLKLAASSRVEIVPLGACLPLCQGTRWQIWKPGPSDRASFLVAGEKHPAIRSLK